MFFMQSVEDHFLYVIYYYAEIIFVVKILALRSNFLKLIY